MKDSMEWSHQTVFVIAAWGFVSCCLAERLVAVCARTRALVRYNSAGTWGWIDHSPVKEYIKVVPGGIRYRDSLWHHAIQGGDVYAI